MKEDLLNDLNDAQREAVAYCDGPSLVIAGAGSGKTRVLTYKVAYLIESGISPYRILTLTFTNKASNEMKQRISSLLNRDLKNMWMGTFHSVFCKILRFEAQSIGFTKDFTIYDASDAQSLVKNIIKEMNLDGSDAYKPQKIYSRISMCKNKLILPGVYANSAQYIAEDESKGCPQFAEIYMRYFKRMQKDNVMDFDDLLLYTNILFKSKPEILAKYQERFDYILVDEYQDTNRAQYIIIRALSDLHRKICVVGDDAQSIYSFRGADISNILNFKNDYPEYKLFKLEQNYRSSQNIVNAANSLIQHNSQQIKKNVFSTNEVGDKIMVRKADTDRNEGVYVASKILGLNRHENVDYSNIAVLYRTNAQSRIMEESIKSFNIPYVIYGGMSFYQRKEIKDVLAYVRYSINHNDTEAFRRIVNYPKRKLGDTTISKVMQISESLGVPVWTLITQPQTYLQSLSADVRRRLLDFALMIDRFSSRITEGDAYDFLKDVVNNSGIYLDLTSEKTEENKERLENVQELLNGAKMFSETMLEQGDDNGILAYLESVALLTDEENNDDDKSKVSLMTIHSAKGLEYDYVFIVGVEENLFPSIMSIESINDIEEERRLFYVALTRAKKQAFIYYAANRFRFGNSTPMRPSRFIRDIDAKYLDLKEPLKSSTTLFFDDMDFDAEVQPRRFVAKERPQSTILPPKTHRNLMSINDMKEAVSSQEDVSYEEGMIVAHKVFGKGKIEKIVGNGQDARIIIAFDTGETKTLLLKFAKLQILN